MRKGEDVKNITNILRRVPVPVIVVTASVAVGVGAGALAELLKWLMAMLWRLFAHGIDPDRSLNWLLLALPVAGILITMIMQRYVLKRDLSCGSAKLIKKLHGRGSDYNIPVSDSVWSIILCSLTVGFGASAGSEGPTALSGGALASGIGRKCGLEARHLRMLVAIGGGAGIAAIFKAPVGGMLYAMEVLEIEFGALAMFALVLGCLTASVTSMLLSGTPFDVSFGIRFPDNADIGWIMLLGVFLGFYSLWYVWTRNKVCALLDMMKNPWGKALLTGVAMSWCVFLVPALFGEGDSVMVSMIRGDFPTLMHQGVFATHHAAGTMFFLALTFILLVKGILVAAANNGGGVAGEMVPAMFIGAVAGSLFGHGINQMFGTEIPVWYMSLAAMGAMLGCSTHAPLMSVFILAEMTNSLRYMPAYVICALISYIVMKYLNPRSFWFNTGHDDLKSLRSRLRHTPPQK